MTESDAAQSPAEVPSGAPSQPTPRMRTVADAARDAVPIVVGYVTLGLAAGMLLVAEGLAWFLVHDGAATLTGGNPSAWPSAASPMGALEILGGTAACAAALFMISRSSLGAFVVGAISVVVGLPFVLMPGVTKSILGSTVERLQAHSDLGRALSTYVMDDGLSGRFILMGVLTIMVAVVAHLARRSGQREQEADDRGRRD